MRFCLMLTVSSLLCLWVAWADPSPQVVIHSLERVLRQTIVNPKDANGVTLRIVPASPEETAKGKFQSVEISTKPAKIKGVFLREFYGRAIEPVVDVNALLREGELKTVAVKESVMEGVMDAEALEQIFAEGKSTRPMKIKVRITDDGRIQLRGILTLLRINNPFEASLKGEGGTKWDEPTQRWDDDRRRARAVRNARPIATHPDPAKAFGHRSLAGLVGGHHRHRVRHRHFLLGATATPIVAGRKERPSTSHHFRPPSLPQTRQR